MKFEYCTLYYNWKDDYGTFGVSPQTQSSSDLHLAREVPSALNKLGEEGWELVGLHPITTVVGPKLLLIFKKRIEI